MVYHTVDVLNLCIQFEIQCPAEEEVSLKKKMCFFFFPLCDFFFFFFHDVVVLQDFYEPVKRLVTVPTGIAPCV